ncbi:MAG: DUF4879 domain-containing protein [Candidatus Desantisbacteria bacterium]
MIKKLSMVMLGAMVVAFCGAVMQEKQVGAGSAPPLTELQVWAVRSERHPSYEYLSKNNQCSRYDHGGKWMHIVTREIGIGFSQYAEMGGRKLTLLRRDTILFSGSNIVAGWLCYWNASGNESGTFKYQNTSCNPKGGTFGTMYTKAYIK